MNTAKKKIAYSGVQGAYAGIVAGKVFPGEELLSFPSFRHAYEAVEKGECDFAVLPVENSFAGEVAQVMDLLFGGDLKIYPRKSPESTNCRLCIISWVPGIPIYRK